MTFHLNPAVMLPAVILFLLFWIAVIGSFVMWCRETRRANEFEKKFRDAEKEIRKLERQARVRGMQTPPREPFPTIADIVRTIDGLGQPRNPLPKVPPKGPPPTPSRRHTTNVTHIHHHHQYGPDIATGEPLSAPRCAPRGSDNDHGGSSGSDSCGSSE